MIPKKRENRTGYWSGNAVTCSLSNKLVCRTFTHRHDAPTGLYLLEFRATWGQNLPRHQQPVALINPGMEGRNHLPSCVPISTRATEKVCFHTSGECSKTHARPTGALFSTQPWVIHFSSSCHSFSSVSLSLFLSAQVYFSWPWKSPCCHLCFQHSNQIHINPVVGPCSGLLRRIPTNNLPTSMILIVTFQFRLMEHTVNRKGRNVALTWSRTRWPVGPKSVKCVFYSKWFITVRLS